MDFQGVREFRRAAVIVRGLGADIVQGDDALAAILGAGSVAPAVPKPESVDASGLPQGYAAAATTVIEVATVAAVIGVVLLAARLFD